MNRGSETLAPLLGCEDLASMRPRFMNRGSNVDRATAAKSPQRFNEAPIHESGK